LRGVLPALKDRSRRVRTALLPAAIAGDSMLPGLRDGDWVLVRRTRRCRPGDVVAVRDPRQPMRIVVKRAIRPEATGWWVVGDNLEASTDSRTFGAVPPELVVCRVVLRYWPRPRLFAR
jgi:nickel-type superoxide dismutase maturation protease